MDLDSATAGSINTDTVVSSSSVLTVEPTTSVATGYLTSSMSTSTSDDKDDEVEVPTASDDLDVGTYISSLQEEQSKFQKHGNFFLTSLKTELQRRDLNTNQKLQIPLLSTYQIEAIFKVKAHFDTVPPEGHFKAALIIAPPGSGKSGMVTFIPYVLNSKKVLVLTPSIVITLQMAAEFGHPAPNGQIKPFFKKCGFVDNDRHLKVFLERPTVAVTQADVDHMTEGNLVIVNAQKFGGRAANSMSPKMKTPEQISAVVEKLSQFDTVIVDEAHHYPAATWVNIVNLFTGKKVVFLTATPFRGHGDIPMHITNLAQVETVYEIQARVLEGVTIRRVEFIERSAVNEDIGSPDFLEQLSDDIHELLQQHKGKEPRAKIHQALILVLTKFEAQEVAQGLGDLATVIVSTKEGMKNLETFTKGVKQIGVVCGMLREGYDNSNVSLVVILRKVKSPQLFEQFCGRCMRVNRELTGKWIDRTVGTVLSYNHFHQSSLWAQRMRIAEEDPFEEGDDEEEEDLGVNILIPSGNY